MGTKIVPTGLKIILLFIIVLFFQSPIIGFTFKTVTKAFVAVSDFNKLKKHYIDVLNKMDEEEFQRKYSEVLCVWPFNLKFSYIFAEHMTKERVIKDIESLDKKRIYATINSIPNKAIAYNFKQYLSNKMQEIKNSNAVKQINNLWNKIIIKERK